MVQYIVLIAVKHRRDIVKEVCSLSAAEIKPEKTIGGEIATLVHESSHYFFGLIGTMILGFISFPLFTRVFPVADYGIIDLVQKYLLVVTAVAKFGLQNSALRFYNAKEFAASPAAERRYYSTMFFGTLGPAVGFTCAFATVILLWPGIRANAGLNAALLVSVVLVIPRAIQSIFWSFLRVEERTSTYNILTVVMKAATILTICAFIRWWHASAALYFAATTMVEAALMIGLMLPLIKRRMLSLSQFDRKLFSAAFHFGVPLVVNEAAFVVLDAGDRTLVQHYLGGEALGIYAVAYGLASLLQNLLMTPLNLAVVPMYLRLWASGEREKTVRFLSTGLDLLLLAGFGLFVLVASTAHDVILLSASSKYRGADDLIPVIFAGLLVFTTYVFVNAGLIIEKKTARIAAVMAASAVVNIALNCVLLPAMGLRGAAIATLLSYVFCICLMGRVAFKTVSLSIEWRRCLGYAVAAGIAWAGATSIYSGPVLLSALVKAALSLVIYAGVLCVVDVRVRRWCGRWRSLGLKTL